eukprot:6953820-Pyramimonas_sp.AAC.1
MLPRSNDKTAKHRFKPPALCIWSANLSWGPFQVRGACSTRRAFIYSSLTQTMSTTCPAGAARQLCTCQHANNHTPISRRLV